MISIIAIIILFITNHGILLKRSENKEKLIYSNYLFSVLAFFIIDSAWGQIESTKSPTLLYICTVVFYILITTTVVLCCQYTMIFLNVKNILARQMKQITLAIFILGVILLCYNYFDPILFYVDQQGCYHPKIIRHFYFAALTAVFALMSIASWQSSQNAIDTNKSKEKTIALFGFSMAIAMLAQTLSPYMPYYTMGLLVGVLIIHVFIHEDDERLRMKEISVLNERLSRRNAQLNKAYEDQAEFVNVVSSLSRSYVCLYYVDLSTEQFHEINPTGWKEIKDQIGATGDTRKKLLEMSKYLVTPEYEQETLTFTNLDTLKERLKDRNELSYQFYGVHARWCEGTWVVAKRDDEGNVTHVLWCIRSINETKAREEAHHFELNKLKMMLESSNIGTWQLIRKDDAAPRLIIDKKMRELMGISPEVNISEEEVHDLLVTGINKEDLSAFMQYDKELSSGNYTEIIYRWMHPTLGERYIRCGGSMIKSDQGNIFSGHHCDVTEQHIMGEELKSSIAANKAKTRFLQNMSHEIRTPLNAMFGFSQLLGMPEGTWPEEEREKYNSYILNSYNMLDLLISDILDCADSEHGNYRMEITDVSINEVCRNALSAVDFRRPGDVEMRFTTDFEDNFIVKSDGRRIQQVLVNYLTNACKNTVQGEIHLHCSKTEKHGRITFSVTDTGKGVPEGKKEEIFGRFTKLDQHVQGSGLGLNICHTIATKLGGEVYLDTSYKNGARFVFVI